MGFRPESTIYKLSFSGTPLDGLTVRAGCCSVGEFNEMLRLSDTTKAREVADNNERITDLFVKYLVEWDLEHPVTGEPVPATAEGIGTIESRLLGQIISAWQIAMVTVPDPLKNGSLAGKASEEASLGLVIESPSPESWPKQN